jgi:hypothetical protein
VLTDGLKGPNDPHASGWNSQGPSAARSVRASAARVSGGQASISPPRGGREAALVSRRNAAARCPAVLMMHEPDA